MKKKLVTVFVSLALTVGLVAGCGSNVAPSQQQTSGETTKSQKQTTYPLTIKDATGTDVTIPSEPKRIVSLLPNDTEILFALGLGDKIVGVSKWADYPAEAKSKPIIGDLKIDTEKVVAQKPDLVIGGASATKQDIEALRKLGITVYAIEPKTISEIEQSITDIGKITNANQQAETVTGTMEKKMNDIASKLKSVSDKPNVYIEVSSTPDFYTAGKGTFLDELVKLAGGNNIFGDLDGWKKINAEQVIAKNPTVIISTHGITEEVQQNIKQRSGWSQVTAVKENKIYAVDTNLVSRPGPRIVEGLEQFVKAIHPGLIQ